MPDDKDRTGREEGAHHQHRRQRGDADRGQGLQGVAADDQLECIERSGQRRVERCRDGAGSAAADQEPHVVAPQAAATADPRRHRRAELGIGRFEPDRGAKPARQQRDKDETDTVAHGHPAAEQRVCLDRVDDLARPPAPQQQRREPNQEPAGDRHHQHARSVDAGNFAQMSAKRDAKRHVSDGAQQNVDQSDAEPGGDAGGEGEHKQKQLAVAQPRLAARCGGVEVGVLCLAGGCDLGHAPPHRRIGDGWQARGCRGARLKTCGANRECTGFAQRRAAR